MFKRINEIRATKTIFAMDLWNAGVCKRLYRRWRRYFHITAAGGVEQCALMPYSNVNIHEVTLLEALQSLF
jgi:hypothetical protein